MTQSFADVIRAVQDLIARDIVSEYAVGGAIGALFWDEVTTTFDVDVFVVPRRQQGRLIDLAPIYEWAAEHGFPQSHEHIKISGIPVQIVPAPDALTEEAIREAAVIDVEAVKARVIRPEYLIAMWLTPPANTSQHKERAVRLRDSPHVDRARLTELLERYHLSW